MRIIAAEAGMPPPAIFDDPAYAKTSTYHLSTSNTSSPGSGASYHDFGGFGAPMTDCYGVAYQIQEHAVQLMVTGDAKCTSRDAHRFADVVHEALRDVYALIADGAPEVRAAVVGRPKAKL